MTVITSLRILVALGIGCVVFTACGSSDDGSNSGAATSTCGNNVLEGSEPCDGTTFGGKTCATVTTGARPSGQLTCNACVIVDTGCTAGTASGTGGMIGTGGGPMGSGGRNAGGVTNGGGTTAGGGANGGGGRVGMIDAGPP